jgi:hypothetical protein
MMEVNTRSRSGISVRSVRDESTWVVTHLYMKPMLGISLCSCPYLNCKNAMSFSLLVVFTLQQNWRKAQNRFCLEARVEAGGRGEK